MQLQERILQLMKDSSDAMSLTFDEFCHIRNVITRSELETLLFDEKLYNEVAQSKLCFTCRKVYFNYLTLTFGVQCSVCKQKVCRHCLTQIALPKGKFHDLPIQVFTPLTLTKSLSNSDRGHSFDAQSPLTPVMSDVLNDFHHDESDARRCSTPGQALRQRSDAVQCHTEPIDICTDCFFLLQQIRKKTRQRHISPATTSSHISSAALNRSKSNYALSTSSSSSSLAAVLAQQQHRSLMVKTTSIHSNLKQARSAQDLFTSHDVAPVAAAGASNLDANPRASLSRQNLFLKLRPAYDGKATNIATQ